jgi:hypothetical protein
MSEDKELEWAERNRMFLEFMKKKGVVSYGCLGHKAFDEMELLADAAKPKPTDSQLLDFIISEAIQGHSPHMDGTFAYRFRTIYGERARTPREFLESAYLKAHGK